MTTTRETPTELAAWVAERVDLLKQLIEETGQIQQFAGTNAEWCLGLLEELSNVEAVSRRMVRLLTAYTLTAQVASPSAVAKASKVTITGATSRIASPEARAAWNEVWPA